ncbi:MAG: discoidin domain-containing protein [Elusimicrobia bacterium]|nr:discoidin domain-containing protein [Elusimicrobiota bacterium]
MDILHSAFNLYDPPTQNAWLNSGNGWAVAPEWILPAAAVFSRGVEDMGTRVVDISGDGLVDIVMSRNAKPHNDNDDPVYSFGVWINNGNGWVESQSWGSPPAICDVVIQLGNGNQTQSKDLGVRFLDVNNDGLVDILKAAGGVRKAWINNGINWVEQPGSPLVPPLDFVTAEGKDEGVRPADINGDGIVDCVQYLDGEAGTKKAVWLGTGNGWVRDDRWLPPFRLVNWVLSDYRVDEGAQLADFNGDGLIDVAHYMTNPVGIKIRRSIVPDKLIQIQNLLGGLVSAQYEFVVQKSTGLPFPVAVVKSVSMSDGLGSTTTINYSFYEGLFDHIPSTEKEFLGFGKARTTDSQGNHGINTFFQSESAVNDVNMLKGLVAEQAAYDAVGNLLTKTTNIYGVAQPYPGVYFPHLSQTNSVLGSKITSAQFEYDAYGNVTKQTALGDVSVSGDETETTIEYVHNTPLNILGLPAHTKVLDSLGNTVSESWTNYDGNALWTQSPTKGRPTRAEAWLSGGANVALTKAYDAHGNLTDEYDAKWNATNGTEGNHARYEYDPVYNLFPVKVTQGAGSFNFIETMAYNTDTGQVLSKTDANGQTTQFVYDTFGRTTKVVGPGDTAAHPTVAYEYQVQPTPPHLVLEKRRINHHQEGVPESDQTLDSYTFLDGLGRVRQTKTPGAAGRQIVSGVHTYDARGLVGESFASATVLFSTSMAVLPANTPKTSAEHDALGRVVRTVFPDGGAAATTYVERVTTGIDPNGNKKETVADAYGRTVEVGEFDGPTKHTTVYNYDALGNLKGIVKSNGETVSILYDSLGRKTWMRDPQMGEWRYEYDANGNLTKQIDGKNQTIIMAYDRLNRPTSKTYPDGRSVVNQYDQGLNAVGRLSKVTDLSGTLELFYDDLGRATQKKRVIDGRTYITQSRYDLLGRDTALVYPDGSEARNVYEGSFLKSVTDAGGAPYAALTYDLAAAGQPATLTYGNGTVTTYAYRADNRMMQNITAQKGSQTLLNLSYTYDKSANVKSTVDGVRGWTYNYDYDGFNRLSDAQGPYGRQMYQYDSVGTLLGYIENPAWDGSLDHPAATASSVWGAGAEATLAMDNNTYTRWTSAAGDPAPWLLIDLGSPRDFNTVVLNWETAYATRYRLLCSLDGKNWTAMGNPYDSDGGIDRVGVGARTARYVRLETIALNPAHGLVSLWEISVTDGRVATASSNAAIAGAAIDGNPYTRWTSDAIDPQWISVDFGQEKAFDTVRIMWEAAYGKSYEIRISTDNANWTVVYATANGDGNVDECPVGDRRARYLRLYATQRGTQWGYSLWEIEAFRSNIRNAALRAGATALTSGAAAGAAVDGSATTGWVSAAADSQWWRSGSGKRGG